MTEGRGDGERAKKEESGLKAAAETGKSQGKYSEKDEYKLDIFSECRQLSDRTQLITLDTNIKTASLITPNNHRPGLLKLIHYGAV